MLTLQSYKKNIDTEFKVQQAALSVKLRSLLKYVLLIRPNAGHGHPLRMREFKAIFQHAGQVRIVRLHTTLRFFYRNSSS